MTSKISRYVKRIIPCAAILLMVSAIYLGYKPPTPKTPTIVDIINDETPLSDTILLKAKFYVFNPLQYVPTFTNVTPALCDYVGEGQVTFSDNIYNDALSTSSLIYEEPDYYDTVSDDQCIEWGSIYNFQDTICIIGLYANKANAIRPSKIKKNDTASLDIPSGFVSVKNFGAVGDGVTDDSDAIISALSQNLSVFFPQGTYKITKQIVIPNGGSLLGEAGSVIDFHGNTTKGYDQGYLVNENSSWLNSSNLAHDISIEKLEIRKSNIQAQEKAILLLSNVQNVRIHECSFVTTYDDAIDTIDFLVNCHNVTVTKCSFYHNQGTRRGGIWIRDRYNQGVCYGTSDILFEDCYFEKNSGKDELIAIFSAPNSSGQLGHVSNVRFNNCEMVRNPNPNDTSGNYNEAYFLDVTLGDTENISFNDCKIKDYNLLIGAVKLLVHSTNNIHPVIFNKCEFDCPYSVYQNSSYIFIREGNSNQQEVAHVYDSDIYAGSRVICTTSMVNFDDTRFYLSDNAVALESSNIANNCQFEISNCTESSRVFRNGKCVLNDSTITFVEPNAEKYFIQPSALNNTEIISSVPVDVQYSYGNQPK